MQNGHKCQFLAKFWAKSPKGRKQNFWYPHIREHIRHLFRVKSIDRRCSNGPLGTKKCLFWNRDFSSKGHITNIAHIDNGPGPGRNYRETAFFTFCQKVFFGPKIHFFPKRVMFFWERGTFFLCTTLPGCG